MSDGTTEDRLLGRWSLWSTVMSPGWTDGVLGCLPMRLLLLLLLDAFPGSARRTCGLATIGLPPLIGSCNCELVVRRASIGRTDVPSSFSVDMGFTNLDFQNRLFGEDGFM